MKSTPLIFFNYLVQNSAGSTLDLYIDGDIVDAPTQELYREWFGDETSVSYKSMRDQVLSNKPGILNIYVNSGGGQVTEAMAMHDFLAELENNGTTVNRYGRGIIASAATYLLMGKNSFISENSWFMIHNVSGYARGDVNEIESAAKLMRKFNNQVRDLYVQHTGASESTVTSWMNKETWFTGKEAVANKFVSSVTGSVEFTNTIKPEQWMFQNTHVLNTYNSFVKNNQPDMKLDLKKIGETVTDAVKKALNIGNAEKEVKPSEMTAEALQNTVSTAVTNALEAVQDSIQEAIDTAVSGALENALKDKGVIAVALTNAITETVKENGAVASAIAAATKTLVTNEALEAVKTAFAEKVGNAGGGKNKNKKEGEGEDKGEFAHEEISWGAGDE